MMKLLFILTCLAAFAAQVLAADSGYIWEREDFVQKRDTTTCDMDNKCPESAPCCSQYGECGTGAYCLGGCDPRMSFQLGSCVPEPVCESKSYTFESLDRLKSNTKYLGNASETDFVVSGNAVSYENNVLLTMAANTAGTVMATSTYMWYGNVKATLKTSRGQGVVTAFILFSDIKDEIDYEFIGSDLSVAQTNYYFQGITDYNNGANISLSDTFSNYHTYEIDWTPDEINWLVDGKVGRTKKRSETWNATSNQWDYPQTPARVQLSLWPGGLASNAPGTIAWAGGEIDWNSQDIQANGYYYATVQSVDVQCYNATSAPGTNNGVSYYYTSTVGTNDTIVDSNNSTVLASLLGSGTDMGKEDPATTASGSASTSTAETVPGLSGTGGSGVDNHSGDDGSGSSSSGVSSAPSSTATGSGGFSQGDSGSSGSGTKSGAATIEVDKVVKGSLVAWVAVLGVMFAL